MSGQILTEFDELMRELLGSVMELEAKSLESGGIDTYRKCVFLRMALTREFHRGDN